MLIYTACEICLQVRVGVNKSLADFFEIVKVTAVRLPETKFVVVEPMQRPAVDWYQEGLAELTKAYSEGLANLQLINVSIIKRFDLPSQYFADDNIHLTDSMGMQFLQAIVYYAEKVYEAEVVDLEKMDTDVEPVASGSGSVEVETKKPIQDQIDAIIRDTMKRRHFDSLVTARIREEMDHLINVKREDRIIVTGLESQTPMPADKLEQKKWRDELVGAALNYLVPESSKGIAFITPGRRVERGVPTMFEVRMKEKDLAGKIRKEFSARMRDKARMQADHYGRLFVANSVTLATRVRSDILKVIAQRCANDNEDFFVIGFTSRPVLSIRRKDSTSQYALSFADAVSKFGSGISRGELQVAYGRAGESFVGQLQQNFVVLHDKEDGLGKADAIRGVPRTAVGGGRKREMENGEGVEPAKRTNWRGRGAAAERGRGSGRGKTGAK